MLGGILPLWEALGGHDVSGLIHPLSQGALRSVVMVIRVVLDRGGFVDGRVWADKLTRIDLLRCAALRSPFVRSVPVDAIW